MVVCRAFEPRLFEDIRPNYGVTGVAYNLVIFDDDLMMNNFIVIFCMVPTIIINFFDWDYVFSPIHEIE